MLGEATTPAIEFRDIPYRVDQTQVLSSLSLQVARVRCWWPSGRSGSGNTSILSHCCLGREELQGANTLFWVGPKVRRTALIAAPILRI